MFFYKPASAPEADSVRISRSAEACRTIVAGFEAGDGIKKTLPDEPAFLTPRVKPRRNRANSSEEPEKSPRSPPAARTTSHTLADNAT